MSSGPSQECRYGRPCENKKKHTKKNKEREREKGTPSADRLSGQSTQNTETKKKTK